MNKKNILKVVTSTIGLSVGIYCLANKAYRKGMRDILSSIYDNGLSVVNDAGREMCLRVDYFGKPIDLFKNK